MTNHPEDGQGDVLDERPFTKVKRPFNFHPKTKEFRVLNQTKLPQTVEYISISDSKSGQDAIRNMIVRGAPCIAAVGCLSLIKELHHERFYKKPDASVNPRFMVEWLEEQSVLFARVRPTAVNLKNALVKLIDEAKKLAPEPALEPVPNPALNRQFVDSLLKFCLDSVKDGEMLNRQLGDYGAKEISSRSERKGPLTLLTHCNTGSLATVGYGTALGIIRSMCGGGMLEHVYCTETRPYNQGSRLTAWELVQEKIPATLIADSMVAYLMSTRKIDAVVVGADCVTADGYVANKIGTLQIAITARHFNVPFYVAAPTQTFDMTRRGSKDIPIEERKPRELKSFEGKVQLAPNEILTWNPGFDVTPANLITAIITERGVCHSNESVDQFISRTNLELADKSSDGRGAPPLSALF